MQPSNQSRETADAGSYVPLEERSRLLAGVPAFSPWPVKIREGLASLMREERFPADMAIVREGEVGSTLYLIASGRVEVTVAEDTGPVLLATLEAGEMFGEGAVFGQEGKRSATVSSVTPILALAIDAPELEDYLHLFPRARQALVNAGENRRIAQFLKRASPFAPLDSQAVHTLSERMQSVTVSAGATIMRQGQHGDTCYLVRSGSVEALVEDETGTERRIAVLESGSIIGEAALLTDAPRNATVRALESCALLVLRRDDLVHVVSEDRHTGDQIRELIQMRARPRRIEGALVQRRNTGDGDLVVTLKSPGHRGYTRLGEDGWIVWERLDGNHTMREIQDVYRERFPDLDPNNVLTVVHELASADLLDAPQLREDAQPSSGPPWWRRWRHGGRA